MTLSESTPIHAIPGIGRRTSKILLQAGVETAGRFIELPDLLLEHTFGPSLPALRKKTRSLLSRGAQNSRRQFYSLISNFGKQLLA